MLIPSGWRLSGGITRVNPLTSGGALNAIGAKLDMTLEDPTGSIRLRWLPEMMYADMRRSPAAAMFPPGSNYNGATVMPLTNAAGFLDQVARREMPRASGWQSSGRYNLPQASASYQQVTRAAGAALNIRYDAALTTAGWQENGTAWEGVFYTAIQDLGAAGLWSNKDTFYVRAPAGQLEKWGGILGIILQSVELNAQWVMGEIQGQAKRGEIALHTQQELARLDREMVEHRQRTNAEINNQAFHNLMRTEEYVNPITKKVEVGSQEWNHRWVNANGEAIYTDDPNYDPQSQGLSGFQRSPVRKRFPDK